MTAGQHATAQKKFSENSKKGFAISESPWYKAKHEVKIVLSLKVLNKGYEKAGRLSPQPSALSPQYPPFPDLLKDPRFFHSANRFPAVAGKEYLLGFEARRNKKNVEDTVPEFKK